ncbi:MAG: glycosyltransferase [Glaciimonas sp.]|nr:glycosyltransferase [Glaciimonas sp.]
MTRLHLVISAVNIIEGGTLTVLRECLMAAKRELSSKWHITAIVHRAELIGVSGIHYIERPDIKLSWLSRVWFEYVECRKLSRQLKADYWLSMHDMTPFVISPLQAVYCHNPMCFYKMTWREAFLDPKLLVFALFYGWLYRINLLANDAVIVQQDWIRTEFEHRYGCEQVIVAHPVLDVSNLSHKGFRQGIRFFYPSFPRVFKNFEILLEAWSQLEEDVYWRGNLVVTVDGSENAYSRDLISRFGHLKRVQFVGRLSHEDVRETYKNTDCLVFPSKLETWGMPLTEAKQYGLAIIAADLPYAHETIASYDGVSFFAPQDASELSRQMRAFSEGHLALQKTQALEVSKPFAQDWAALFAFLLRVR